jgi:hypothetical protein
MNDARLMVPETDFTRFEAFSGRAHLPGFFARRLALSAGEFVVPMGADWS